MPKGTKKRTKEELASAEYARLVGLYRAAGADTGRLEVNDSLIRKVAEVYAVLESMKDLPTILYNADNPQVQRETAAGRARVKYMAQYTASMQKLNKELLGTLAPDDGDGLDDYE